MISQTKNLQNEAIIIGMAERAFGEKTVREIKELKDGFFNAAYLIKFSDHREVVLKIAPPGNAKIMTYEKNLMASEVNSMRLVKQKTSVPIPDILYYSEDDLSFSKKDLILCESPYFFMTKLEGSSYQIIKSSMSEIEQYTIEQELGRFNKQLNNIEGKYFGYYASAESNAGKWSDVFLNMFDNVLKDGRALNTEIGMDYEELIQIVKKYSCVLDNVITPKLVHWDLWDGNIFIKDGHIEGIIDFERCLWGDPLMEYAFRHHNRGSKSGFWEGYGDIKVSTETEIRCRLYDIYLYSIMIIECDYRKYEDNSQYNWSKNMLAEVIEKIRTI